MDKFLRLFPLNTVAFPGEKLNLHIFEPRYKQLVNECLETGDTFGIPAFITDKIGSHGTEVRVLTLSKRYEDGRMDLETEGIGVFKLLKFNNPVTGKLYAGGRVRPLPEAPAPPDEVLVTQLLNALARLYDLLGMKMEINYRAFPLLSWELGHRIGLPTEGEYELLKLRTEAERQLFLLEHLNQTIPVLADMERTKERIRLNGHFRHYDPLTF